MNVNEDIRTDSANAGAWPAGDHRRRVSDTSMLPASGKAPPAAGGLLKNAVQGAHSTMGHLADSAEPAERQLGERVAAAGETMQAKTDQLRGTWEKWVGSVRSTVRANPLASVGAALALGPLIARFIRSTR